jgi:hypothetical protein
MSDWSESEGTIPGADSHGNEDSDHEWKPDLLDCLDNIRSVGEYATFSRRTSFTNPGLNIEGHSAVIPLPLTARDAEIIKSVCRQAPFGKGDETVVDTSVRSTWELDHAQFRLENPAWDPFFREILREAVASLDLAEVVAKPHKLLLYEKGSFFKRHKDSEKEAGMVGTLVVCLPSEHEGGDVHLSFGAKNLNFAAGPTSKFDLTTLAWFSDVTHEIKQLTKGYRLVLTYKLIQAGHVKQTAQFFFQQSEKLRRLLVDWHNEDTSNSLLYPLDHNVCQSLYTVCSQAGVFLLFAHMTRVEEEDEYYGSGEREMSTLLDTIFTCDGKQIGSRFSIEEDEILRDDNFEDRDVDSEDEGEFTGNENAPSCFRYHNTVCPSP